MFVAMKCSWRKICSYSVRLPTVTLYEIWNYLSQWLFLEELLARHITRQISFDGTLWQIFEFDVMGCIHSQFCLFNINIVVEAWHATIWVKDIVFLCMMREDLSNCFVSSPWTAASFYFTRLRYREKYMPWNGTLKLYSLIVWNGVC